METWGDDRSGIEQVRQFNRTVTQRVGALEEAFLSRGRPLAQSRLLWEIGAGDGVSSGGAGGRGDAVREDGAGGPGDAVRGAGIEIRALRARLDLDSGYLSRLLRALESAGLVRVQSEADDARVRIASLTAAGHVERNELDRVSDEQAAGMLAPLSASQRSRLLTAMGEVDRLLTASMVVIEQVDPADADARRCIAAYFAELAERFDGGFDAGQTTVVDEQKLTPPRGVMLLARLHGEAIGCCALVFETGGTALAKRMWVSPAARGLGLGRRILTELERRAREHGSTALRLDTNRVLTEAIAMYRSGGFEEVERFNDEPYAHHWFSKQL